jgi:hypothetical protein
VRAIDDGPRWQCREHIANSFPAQGFAGASDQGAKHHGCRPSVIERSVRRCDI